MEQWIGWVAGSLTTVSLVPQLYHIIRHRSAQSVSWLMFIIFSIGIALWLMYGLIRHDAVIITFNLITFIFSIAVLLAKWHFDYRCVKKIASI